HRHAKFSAKSFVNFCWLPLMLVLALATSGDGRTWKLKSAEQGIEGELADVADGRVELEIADGKLVSVAVNDLSDEDRKYLTETGQPQLAEQHYNRGSSELDEGHYEIAVAAFSTALRLHQAYPEALTNRGIAYDLLGNYKQAVADYSMAIKL